jgi:type IV pilus assembly protein PilC
MQYVYTARSLSGDLVRGRLNAPDGTAARTDLQRRELCITSLAPARAWHPAGLRLTTRSAYSRCRVVYFRSLSTLIRAGVPLRRGLDIAIGSATSASFAAALRDVLGCVERGEPLSLAFSLHPEIFPAAIVAMTAAGEAGGILDDVLDRIARLSEREELLRKNVVSALAYPATLFLSTCGLVLFLMVRVVPSFAALFRSLHVALPASTRALMAFADVSASPAAQFTFLSLFAGALGLLGPALQSDRGRHVLDRIRLRLPIVGSLLKKATLARLAGLLGTLVHAGIELSAALDLCAGATGSPVHAGALKRVARALRDGDALTPPLRSTGLFDPMFLALVGAGEEAGMLEAVLPKAADYFEADVAAAIATLGSVIEPALILLLGAVVGFVVYSIYVPLYSLIGSISQ